MLALYVTTLDPMSTAGGPGPADLFELRSAFVQTLVLLVSSLTFGMASLGRRLHRSREQVVLWLAVTPVLGVGFVKIASYAAVRTCWPRVPGRTAAPYLSAFFGLVPLYGLHVAIGCLWITTMMVQVLTLGLIQDVTTRLLRRGLFLHFSTSSGAAYSRSSISPDSRCE